MIHKATLLLCWAASPALADSMTFDDLRTDVGAIHSHVDSATWTAPATVTVRNAGEVWEVQGTISGVGWGTTTRIPVREDLSLDGTAFGPNVVVRTVDAATSAHWVAVTGALDHDEGVVVGPSIACRVGGYQLRFAGTLVTAFAPDELARRYGSFTGYRDCIDDNLDALEAERLYDPRVESAAEIAARECALFGAGACPPPVKRAR